MKPAFTHVGEIQAIAEMYSNTSFIADLVMPRVRVNSTVYRYYKFPDELRFTVPGTSVGRYSRPNQTMHRWTQMEGFTKDWGLDEPISSQDLRDAQASGVDMRLSTAETVTELIRLDREIRVANLVFDSNNYASGLSVTLSGTDQFDDPASNPIPLILDALDAPLVRPNTMVFGVDAWRAFRANPKIVEAIRGAINPGNNAASVGFVNEADVASLFRVDRVLIGDARVNDNAMGVTPSLSRVWTDSLSLIYVNNSIDTTLGKRVTWGFTAEYGTVSGGIIPDPDIGLYGGIRVRVGESLDEKVIATSAGYLFSDCVS